MDIKYPNKSLQLNTKEQEESIKPVIPQGSVTVKKPSEFQKLKRSFFAEDGKGIIKTVWSTVILPKLKAIFVESATSAANTAMYGTSAKPTSGNRIVSSLGGIYSNYGSMFGGSQKPQTLAPAKNTIVMVDELEFQEYGHAEGVLQALRDIISSTGKVSVNQFYDICGIKGNNPNDVNYGWFSLDSAKIISCSGGYKIALPNVTPLK